MAAVPLALVLWLAVPSVASAESLCTDTWVGPAEGNWQTTADWSLGTVPTSTDVACVGTGKTVKVTEGSHQAGVVQGGGALFISGGSLEVTNALEASSIGGLIVGGTLTGSSEVDVTGSFVGEGGTLEGSGKTVIEPGASGVIFSGKNLSLTKRTLVNEASLTISYPEGGISGASGATIVNHGTLTVNGQGETKGIYGSGTLTNTGTVQKTEGTGTTPIRFAIDNESAVKTTSGKLELTAGGVSGESKTDSWSASGAGTSVTFASGSFALGPTVSLSGSITLSAATLKAGEIEGSTASLSISTSGCCSHGTVEVTGTTASTVQSLTVGGTLTGSGEVDVTGSFVGEGGTLEGSGKTVIEPGALGVIFSGKNLSLTKRTLVNEASLTIPYPEGGISGAEGATIVNHGTLTVNGQGETKGLFAAGTATATLTNTGTVQKTEGTGASRIAFAVDNENTVSANTGTFDFLGGGTSGKEKPGSWSASSGAQIAFGSGAFALGSTVPLSGSITLIAATVTAGVIEGGAASVNVSNSGCCEHGDLEVNGTGPSTLSGLSLTGTLTGSGEVDVTKSFSAAGVSGTHMLGSGKTVLKPGSSGTINSGPELNMAKRTLVNEGSLTVQYPEGGIDGKEGATVINHGTFTINGQGESSGMFVESPGPTPLLVNTGTVQKTEGTSVTHVRFGFENYGTAEAHTGRLEFTDPIIVALPEEQLGSLNPSALAAVRALCGDPVDCVTGNYSETQTDLKVGGLDVGLNLTRTYNALAAAKAASAGAFGYGWASSFSDHLAVETASKQITLHQANGSTATFTEGSGETFTPPAWSADTLTGNTEAGYTLTLADQTKFLFNGSGRLESERDRNGNQTTLSYNEKDQLATITDPAGRKITLAYNAGGQVESAKDPMGNIVKYTYEGGNLVSVTLPGETSPNWRFKYDASHRLAVMINGLGGETTNTYDGSNRVASQKDPLGHVLKFEYETFQTKITNEATGAVTLEQFGSSDLITSITHGYGTSLATTEKITYNERNEPASRTDGNGHTTSFEYDGAGNKIREIDPEGHETKWTFNGTHDVLSVTRPSGEATTITRDEHGNPTKVSRPAPKETTQETGFEYNGNGQVTGMTDPLGREWTYGYDANGDRTSETDPEGDKRTWAYNEDSQEVSTVSPRGNVEGGEPTKYTMSIERDAQGRPVKITDPLGHETHYSYDADGNQTSEKDANGHETKTTYNAANQPIKATEPNGTIVETGYDGAGQVISQTDGNKHTTKYTRNVLEQVTEITDPLLRKSTKTYDLAGNLHTLTDQSGRTTTYTYNKDNQLTKVAYSDGVTPTVEYEYDANGNRTSMTDGSGKTTDTYDQLDRLTKSEDGHGDTTGYEYDLAEQQTKIVYPNGKTVERTYDKAGRLHSLTDWLEHTTAFAYDQDSNLTATTFAAGTGEQDTYAYNEADQQTEIKMSKDEETLASLAYTRDNSGQVIQTVVQGLPGAETTEYGYDENERLIKAGANKYEYDAANNPITAPGSTNTFDAADELTEGTGVKYSYDEQGERTKATPTSVPATTYGYNQAGDLTSVSRPEEGETPKIEDSYAYNGDGLRVSQMVAGKTSYLALDTSNGLPLILNDGANSYIYGPAGIPVEQIDGEGKVQYLHHDQAGSTRLITSSTGTVEGAYTYTPYGVIESHTGTAATSLGYDGQYTDSDTGLIYLRARVYDPTTAQFMSVDPLSSSTGLPYTYAGDNPLNAGDPPGLLSIPLIGDIGAGDVAGACGATAEVPGLDAITCGAAGAAAIYLGYEAARHILNAAENESEAEGPSAAVEGLGCGEASPSFSNPAESPGEGWEWKGKGSAGSKEGAWYNPKTDESLHPDLDHADHGPHYDYVAPDGTQYRVYPDGRIEPKQP